MSHPDPDDLARIPLFASLARGELTALARHLEVVAFRSGEQLVRQGELGYAFYVLRDGAASVTREGVPVASLERGDFFGEVALLAGGRRHATVTATEPGVAWCMFGTGFRVFEARHPEIAAKINQRASDRLAV